MSKPKNRSIKNIDYVFLRLIRHFMPDKFVKVLLNHGIIIKPGLETRSPDIAVERLKEDLSRLNYHLGGKRVMIFGYGGNPMFACEMLKLGAEKIVLCERAGFPDINIQSSMINVNDYFINVNGRIKPDPKYMDVLHDEITNIARRLQYEPVDLVLSSSVFEHLGNVTSITQSLASITSRKGIHIHYIDLRDHYFKYPFEMLCFSENTWVNWLNPGSNLNRLRLNDYQLIFAQYFNKVEIDIMENNVEAFENARPHIREKFISGDNQADSATMIRVTAKSPI